MIPDTVFTLDAAKGHLRVLHDHEDADILRMLDAAVARAEKLTGRALTERTVEMIIGPNESGALSDGFFAVPLAPIADDSVVFEYFGDNGAPVAMPAGSYSVRPSGIVVHQWPGGALLTHAAARLIYTAAPLGSVPADAVAAVMLFLGDLYANREGGIVGSIYTPNPTAEKMLWSLKQDMVV
jgi:hypothetical protein